MSLLNRTECSALRGLAILCIFLHNYIHWLGPMVKENEFMFHQSKVDRMMDLLINPTSDLPYHLISFFGHYGVPVFLFLSGFGLVLKYESMPSVSTSSFMWNHYRKFFPMMLLGFVCFAMVDWMTPGRHHWTWIEILGQLAMVNNLFPDPDHVIWPGPFWFFGIMMQLYLVYRLLIYKRHWAYVIGLVVLCWIVQILFINDSESEALNSVRYNFIGSVLPFGMGVLAARWQDYITPNLTRGAIVSMFIGSLMAVVALSLSFTTWLMVPVFVIVLCVTFVKMLPMVVMKWFDWLGVLSASIFVCHPITRKLFIPISRGGNILDGLVLYIVATILLAMLFRLIIINMQKNKVL